MQWTDAYGDASKYRKYCSRRYDSDASRRSYERHIPKRHRRRRYRRDIHGGDHASRTSPTKRTFGRTNRGKRNDPMTHRLARQRSRPPRWRHPPKARQRSNETLEGRPPAARTRQQRRSYRIDVGQCRTLLTDGTWEGAGRKHKHLINRPRRRSRSHATRQQGRRRRRRPLLRTTSPWRNCKRPTEKRGCYDYDDRRSGGGRRPRSGHRRPSRAPDNRGSGVLGRMVAAGQDTGDSYEMVRLATNFLRNVYRNAKAAGNQDQVRWDTWFELREPAEIVKADNDKHEHPKITIG